MSDPATLAFQEAPMSTPIAPIPGVLMGLALGSTMESETGTLTVVQRSFGHVAVARVLDGSAVAESVTLTSDGRSAHTDVWHTGPEGEWVFVERWTAAGRAFHGWVDGTSRKLLQTG